MPNALDVTDVVVSYGATRALRGVSLFVPRGEVLALLGPSGSGKTTLLQASAGFVDVEDGEIAIDGVPVSRRDLSLAPEKRRAGVVFQSYALWPHMSVVETVAFPFERRGIASGEAKRRAAEMLERMGLGEFLARKPGQLSGGQQQRVGLARALAVEPAVFLFDEPTANLDTALRASLQAEIRAQQQRTDAGALYITHDPTEAFRVADRVAILRQGLLVQVAPPVAIYRAPANRWVVSLTGGGSVIPATVVGENRLHIGASVIDCTIHHPEAAAEGAAPAAGADGEVCLRPGWTRLGEEGALRLPGRVRDVRFQGYNTDYVLDTPVGEVLSRDLGEPRFATGSAISWEPTTAAALLPTDDGAAGNAEADQLLAPASA